MRKIGKFLGVLLLLVVLLVVGFCAVVGFVTHRSKREVVATVAQFSPGASFSTAVQRLGPPAHTFTDGDEIVSWVEGVGARRVEASVAKNSVLHTFVHRGPPFRWILIYTDRASQRIVSADWCAM